MHLWFKHLRQTQLQQSVKFAQSLRARWLQDVSSKRLTFKTSMCFPHSGRHFLWHRVPSGNLLHSYWKWPSRNSGFSQLWNLMFHSFLYVFQAGYLQVTSPQPARLVGLIHHGRITCVLRWCSRRLGSVVLQCKKRGLLAEKKMGMLWWSKRHFMIYPLVI